MCLGVARRPWTSSSRCTAAPASVGCGLRSPTTSGCRSGVSPWPARHSPTSRSSATRPCSTGCRWRSSAGCGTTDPAAGGAGDRPRPVLSLVCVGGPDAGRSHPLEPPGLEVGRSPQRGLRLADPSLSRAHARVEVGADGVFVTDLGSTNGVRVDGAVVTGRVAVHTGSTVVIGASTLRLRRAPGPGTPVEHPGDGTVRVSPGRALAPHVPEVRVDAPPSPPEPTRARIPWVAALAPVPVVAVLAVFLGPHLLAFALVGPIALLATGLADRIGGRRRRARDVDEHAAAVARARRRLEDAVDAECRVRHLAHPDPDEVLRRAEHRLPGLWSGPDDLAVRVGLGDLPSRAVWAEGGGSPPGPPETSRSSPTSGPSAAWGCSGPPSGPRRCSQRSSASCSSGRPGPAAPAASRPGSCCRRPSRLEPPGPPRDGIGPAGAGRRGRRRAPRRARPAPPDPRRRRRGRPGGQRQGRPARRLRGGARDDGRWWRGAVPAGRCGAARRRRRRGGLARPARPGPRATARVRRRRRPAARHRRPARPGPGPAHHRGGPGAVVGRPRPGRGGGRRRDRRPRHRPRRRRPAPPGRRHDRVGQVGVPPHARHRPRARLLPRRRDGPPRRLQGRGGLRPVRRPPARRRARHRPRRPSGEPGAQVAHRRGPTARAPAGGGRRERSGRLPEPTGAPGPAAPRRRRRRAADPRRRAARLRPRSRPPRRPGPVPRHPPRARDPAAERGRHPGGPRERQPADRLPGP